MKKFLIIALIGAIVLIGLIFGFKGTGNMVEGDSIIKIPLNEISEKASFYEYGGTNYFTVLGSDGKPRVALDACDVCGGHKGYRQEGEYMVCNNCGQKFHVNYLGSSNINGGGCWPSHLEGKIEGDYLVIQKSDLKENEWRFK